jgi:hypothetical protein
VNIISFKFLNVPPVTALDLGIVRPSNDVSQDIYRIDLADINVQIGPFPSEPVRSLADSLTLLDTVSYGRGSHSFRFGGEISHTDVRRFNPIDDDDFIFFYPGASPFDPAESYSSFQNFLVESEILTSELGFLVAGARAFALGRVRVVLHSISPAFRVGQTSVVTTTYRARFSWVSTLWTWNFRVRGVVCVLPCLPRFPLAPLLGSRAAISVIWVAIWLRVNSQLFARGRFRYSTKTSGSEHFPVALCGER